MPAQSPATYQGFTLIEILVSMIVFSIGLLGLAGLQLSATHVNLNSYLRTMATMQAEDIMDRMRANIVAVQAGDYNVPMSHGIKNNHCYGKNAADLIDTSLFCTSSELAAHDIYEWKHNVANALPGASAVLCVDSTPNDDDATPIAPHCDNISTGMYAIKLWWLERSRDNALSSLVFTFKP